MIVMKFGGTSVKTSDAMQATARIVESTTAKQRLVVLSACGGITDKLLSLARASGKGDIKSALDVINDITLHHQSVCNGLFETESVRKQSLDAINNLLADLTEYSQGMSLLCECTPRSLDKIASFGELLSTTIFAHYLRERGLDCVFHDARSTMRTDSAYTTATVERTTMRSLCAEHLLPAFQDAQIVVTQGFIGSNAEGVTTTIGRGGSDLSAALFGDALDASEIQIWTDVSGVLSADPRVIPNARTIPEISFAEIRQLAYYGAKVLHPDTIKPAVDKNIPVRILNTFEPLNAGTVVIPRPAPGSTPAIRSVSRLTNCVMIRVAAPVDTTATRLLMQLMVIAHEANVEILLSLAEESSCAVVVRSQHQHLFRLAATTRIDVDLLCACGPFLSSGIALGALSRTMGEYKPACVVFGASDVSIITLVDPLDSTAALQFLHELTKS
jgi:aspartate kinase